MVDKHREGMGDSMGTGTKIGIILILILVVVVIANLLDSEVQRGPSVEQQVTGSSPGEVPSVRPPRTGTSGPSIDEPRRTRPGQERDLVTAGTSTTGVVKSSGDVGAVGTGSTVAPELDVVSIKPAISPVTQPGVSRATAVIRSGGRISSPSEPTPVRASARPAGVNNPASTAVTTVIVKVNDTQWDIAKRYLGSGLRWTELLELNPGLREDSILQPGQKLRIPARGVTVKKPASSSTRSVVPPSGFRSVLIRDGDTLWDLAEEYLGSGIRWIEIRDANPGLDPGRLSVGNKILIPR